MRRFLPYPLLAGALFLMWLVLGDSYSRGRILLGAVVAVSGAWITTALRLDNPSLRRPRAALRLARLVTIDIIRSNFAVARIIMWRERSRRRTANFLPIPLDLREPMALTILACIITATPGTIWVDYNRASGTLLLHVLDLVDREAWIQTIKERYEALLMEIFE